MPIAAAPYLSGNFAPVSDEATIVGLDVEGTLPAALSGTFMRHGPNPIGTPPTGYRPSDGDGMIHAVSLRAGRALGYRNRWVRTSVAAAKLGVEPSPGPPQPADDRSNDNIVLFGRRILSTGENALPHELTADVDTVGRIDFNGALRHGMAAHAKIDPATSTLLTLSTSPEPPYLWLHAMTTGTSVTAPLSLTRRVVVHDFSMTGRHLVVFDHGHLGVIDRRDLVVRWIDTNADPVDHAVNAYDTREAVVVDVVAAAKLERWTIADGGDRRVLDDTPQHAPRINDAFVGASYRYAYTVALESDGLTPANRLLKHDVTATSRDEHDFGAGVHPGEFVFVPDPARPGPEDGGWLVGYTHHDTSRETRLVVLDAQHVAEPPVATVHIPRRVPFGTHAAWVPAR